MRLRPPYPAIGAQRSDAGLSLIELIIAVVVSMVVLAGIAAVLVNSWLTQSDVLSSSEATNRGQLVSSAVEKAMRNALYFEIKNGGSELWVRTTFDNDADGNGLIDDDRHCQAFHIADGVAEMKSSSSRVDLASWGEWLDVTNYDAFVVKVEAPTGGVFGQTPVTGIGTTLVYDFSVETDSAPVMFTGEVSVRAGEVGNGGCW